MAKKITPSVSGGQLTQHATTLPFQTIKKRDGSIVPFNKDKVTNAIFKAFKAAGLPYFDKAEEVAEAVISRMSTHKFKNGMPGVEEIQDLVEQTLIDKDYAKVAKAYIIYRHKRMEVRQEKEEVLGKAEIDEVDKRFDLNALRVLRARYLRKSEDGTIEESPKDLFRRVSLHTLLPSLLYDKKVYARKGTVFALESFDPKKYDKKFHIGNFFLNEFHLDGLKRIYDRANANGKVKVSWSDLLQLLQDGYFEKYVPTMEQFYAIMVHRQFLPNTPALANFGNYLGMGSACFVLDVEDSIESIMDTLKAASIIFKSGGGVGYNFSKLRPEGDFVKTTAGTASGPLSFMSMFDNMTDVIKQGGIRRGANMGIINSNHPDIERFITAKAGNKALRNFNISVLIMDDFWEYYKENKPYPLVNPRTGKVVRHTSPRALFDRLVYQAWESAEPGVIFFDHSNEYNPLLKALGPIVTTNPCGEVLLYPNESCNLGSINVWSFVTEDAKGNVGYDWDALRETVMAAMTFLDNVIDINKYPLPQIEEVTLATRKIGLGVMGVGDLLYALGLSYSSPKGVEFMEQLMEFINYHSKVASIELARERGSFALFDKSFYPEGKLPISGYKDPRAKMNWKKLIRDIKEIGLRNTYTTVIAPTGSISMIAGTSSGMEPVFSLVFEKNVSVGSFYYVDPVFEEVMSTLGLLDDELIKEVATHRGSIRDIDYIPEKYKKTFVTAMDIEPKDHIKALAAFQKWVDSSISKTNNFPANATVEDVRESYLLAYKLGCKDVTVFRDSSIQNQVLNNNVQHKDKKPAPKKEVKEKELITVSDAKAEGIKVYQTAGAGSIAQTMAVPAPVAVHQDITECPNDGTTLVNKEGCKICPVCSWGLCL